MSPLLSVVVPFYNVAGYLGDCLESVARQTLHDLEVVMVDDGSADDGAEIAEAFAARDTRFRLVRQENRGLGLARNTGVLHSTGRYLAFVDSDDVVPRYAFDLMVSSLEETGSDIACGGVRRMGVAGLQRSPMHEETFRVDRRRTHVREFPELLRDRTAWNKVFRRSFWDAHGFRFPAGLYEDIPVTVPAHVLAEKVDVLRDVVYHWRVRETGPRSITQRRTEPGNLADRMRSVRTVSDFLARNAPDLKDAYDKFALVDDIRLYVNVIDRCDDAYRRAFLTLVNDFLDRVSPDLCADLPALDRLKFHAVRERLTGELVEIVSFAKSSPERHSAVRRPDRPDRWYGDYPYLGDPRFPDHLYELGGELKLTTGVDEVGWRRGRLRVAGHAYIARLDAPERDDTEIKVQVRGPGKVLDCAVKRVRRPDVTAASGQATACHDWSGFTVEIDPAELGAGEGVWQIHVTVIAKGVRRRGRLNMPSRPGTWPSAREIPGGRLVKPKVTQARNLVIAVQPIRGKVTDVAVDGERVRLSGWVSGEDSAFVHAGTLTAAFRQGSTTVSWPVTATGRKSRGRVAFSAVADLAALAERTRGTDAGGAFDGIEWDVFLAAGEHGRLRLAVHAELLDLRAHVSGREFDVISTTAGNLTFVERAPRPVITRVRWAGGPALRVSGSSVGGSRPDRLLLRRRRGSDRHEVPITWDGDRFTALLPARGRDGLPLPSGTWDLYAAGDGAEIPVGIDRASSAKPPEPRRVGVHELSLRVHRGDLVNLRVRAALSDDERGPYAQRRLQQRYCSPGNRAPIRDRVVFESYSGHQYACNPRAVYEEMERRKLGLEYVWSVADGQFTVPGSARTVLRGTREYYELISSARIVVSNDLQIPGYRKRPGQTYVQTWHGTPYKHIGHDLLHSGLIAGNITELNRCREDVPHWDHLISPAPHVTGLLRQAFRYDGDVLEVGYPRTDPLLRADGEDRARRVRERLGVPPGRRVALYLPTWREDVWLTKARQAELPLDTAELAAGLGDAYSVLVRQHHRLADRTAAPGEGVVDVTRYPDLTDLYLAADVLITDYSSAMFDFAVTGRPILFFTPDLQFYQDELRGSYFHLPDEAPGPLLRETGEVADALHRLNDVADRHRDAYAAFRRRYCALNDGSAAARLVDRLLG